MLLDVGALDADEEGDGMTLAEFLLARIAEDEQVARSSLATHEEGEPWGYGHLPDDGPHIARWSPARVLAECAAKREIVERFVAWDAVRLLAAPYSAHPDYDKDWRP